MNENEREEELRRVAEAARAACLRAAREAYEQASLSGLCAEGAWECALGAIQTADLEPILRNARDAGAEASPP